MQYSLALLSLASAVVALPQAVTSDIAPSGETPEVCSPSYDGTFQIQVVNVSSTSTKRSFTKRQEDESLLRLTLTDGVLTDDEQRTGYIAANRQFQFDAPPQEGAIFTAGWSVCANGSLAIGDDAVFYQCLSGEFYNLYDESLGAQCNQVYINAIGAAAATPAASQAADGQVTETPAAPVSAISDGQIQASTGVSSAPVSQISDGQIQAATTPAAPVTQISDGQIQAPTSTAAVVSQISDGQIQAPTSTAGVVSQISDGQIQAPTSTAAVVSQISDGQIQAPTTAGVVTQIGDGQIQAPTAGATGGVVPANGTMAGVPSPSVQPFEGAASTVGASIIALAAGVVAVLAL